MELLETLQARRLPFAILTRNSAANAWISLRAIGAAAFFDLSTVIGRDEAPAKPDPAGITLLARKFGQPTASCAMIGDYRHDLQAGTTAGCHTVHIRHAGTPAWPDLTHTQMADLLELKAAIERGEFT